MKKWSAFDKRMKKYEFVTRNYLTTRTPAIIRIDGKCFHTFAKGFNKPFDDILSDTMQETMKYLCENIQGCVLGYTQSVKSLLFLLITKSLIPVRGLIITFKNARVLPRVWQLWFLISFLLKTLKNLVVKTLKVGMTAEQTKNCLMKNLQLSK